jgi:hypothetical protein
MKKLDGCRLGTMQTASVLQLERWMGLSVKSGAAAALLANEVESSHMIAQLSWH